MITNDDWMAAVDEANEITADPSARTVRELSELAGVSERSMETRINKLLSEGKVQKVGKKYVTDSLNRRQTAWAYVLVKEK